MPIRLNILLPMLLATCWLAVQPVAAENEPAQEELRTFAEVFERIRSHHVENLDDERLIRGAIRGMLAELDPDSAYLNEQAFQALRETTRGQFGGIGIEVNEHVGRLKVIAPMDHTPAHKAGIQPGDLIETIDHQPVAIMTLDEAVEAMRGAPGSKVHLVVFRPSDASRMELEIEREIIEIPSVSEQLLTPDTGYLRIAQFQRQSKTHVRLALENLQEHAEGPLRGLVLDLRNNPGGALQAAVDVASLFLDDRLVVATRGRAERQERIYRSSSGAVIAHMPMVVLVNQGSASAAEILAAALRDHARAVMIGTQTFGKGSVQTLLPLSGGRGLKLTTARYYSPAGSPIDAQGLTPDITIDPTDPALAPIAGESIHPILKTAEDSASISDPQLRAALEWLHSGCSVPRAPTTLDPAL